MTTPHPASDDVEPIAVESLDTAMLTCPYYQGIKGGRCVSGCWEEPACHADEPTGGWRARDRHGKFITVTKEQLRATAQDGLDDYLRRHPPLHAPKEQP
ncbi:hypothetical protein [Prescottella agglutinans]|uniref:Uncharacterized protein n=1 Tax=Prescottella agglutinans TaxID=1644129 RepID=A0ABT6MI80_9NOCA|nr:hypothetical protein [Prescottella agglutinans]MDH6284036.1 hypothetical protein [Prescottella agglutinans]